MSDLDIAVKNILDEDNDLESEKEQDAMDGAELSTKNPANKIPEPSLGGRGGSRVRLVSRMTKSRFLKKLDSFYEYENMKDVSHDIWKKYKILQELVCIMITVNNSSNLLRFVRSAVTNELWFETVPQYGSSVISAAFFKTFC